MPRSHFELAGAKCGSFLLINVFAMDAGATAGRSELLPADYVAPFLHR